MKSTSTLIASSTLVMILTIMIIHTSEAYQSASRSSISSAYNGTQIRRDIRLNEKTARQGQDKKAIIQFLNTKNVVKTMLKLLFGTNEESVATSRQVLNVFVKVR